MPKNIDWSHDSSPPMSLQGANATTCTFNPEDTVGLAMSWLHAPQARRYFLFIRKQVHGRRHCRPARQHQGAFTFSVGHEHIDLNAAGTGPYGIEHSRRAERNRSGHRVHVAFVCIAPSGEADQMVRNGDWIGWAPTQMLGVGMQENASQSWGWVASVAKLQGGRAFGMTIHYHNRSPLSDDMAEGAVYTRPPMS